MLALLILLIAYIFVFIPDIFSRNIPNILIVMRRTSVCDVCSTDFADCIYICFYPDIFSCNIPNILIVMRTTSSVCDVCSADFADC